MSEKTDTNYIENISDDEKIAGNLRYCASFLWQNSEGRGSQRRVLQLLSMRGPMAQQEILEEMGIRPGSLSELLRKLEDRGYISKVKSQADKRIYNVFITEEGTQALMEMQSQYSAFMSNLLSGLDETERADLSSLLEKLRGLWMERANDLSTCQEQSTDCGRVHGHKNGHGCKGGHCR